MKDKPDLMSYVRGVGIGILLAASFMYIPNYSSNVKLVLTVVGFVLLVASLFIKKESKEK